MNSATNSLCMDKDPMRLTPRSVGGEVSAKVSAILPLGVSLSEVMDIFTDERKSKAWLRGETS